MSAYVNIGNVKGESTDQNHKDWVIIQSMSASFHRSIPQGAKDQQRSRGETTCGDVVLVRDLDKSSVKLAEACATGKYYDSVEIHMCSDIKGKREPYLKYKLANVVISSYSFHGNSSGEPVPSEEVTLSYTGVDWTYIILNPNTGSPDGNVPGSYQPGTGAGT